MKLNYFVILFIFLLTISFVNADYSVNIKLTNTESELRNNVPVFITLKEIFGDDYDFESIELDGFILNDPDSNEVPYNVFSTQKNNRKGSFVFVFLVEELNSNEELIFNINYGESNSNSHSIIDYINNENNLLDNPDFENWDGDLLDGFSTSGDPNNWAGTGQAQKCMSSKKSGLASLRMDANHNEMIRVIQSEKIQMLNDKKYELRFWSKTNNVPYADTSTHSATNLGGQVSDEYRSWSNGGTVIDGNWWHSWIIPIAGTRDWMEYSKTIITNQNKNIDFRWRFYNFQMDWMTESHASWWVDDAILFIPLNVEVMHKQKLDSLISSNAFFLQPLEKGITSSTIPFENQLVNEIKITMLKDEFEGIQFGIHSKNSLNINFELSELKNSDDDILNDVKIYEIDEDRVLRQTTSGNIGSDESSGFFIDVKTTDETPAGKYMGILDIKSNGNTIYSIDVEVNVLDYVLPKVHDKYLGTCMPYGERNLEVETIHNLAEIGYNFFSVFWHTGVCSDNDNLGTMFDKLKDNGMDLDAVMLFSDICRRACGGGSPQCGSADKIASIEESKEENDWPEIIYMTDDELFAKMNGDKSLQGLKNTLDSQEDQYSDWMEANPGSLLTADMSHFYASFYNKPYSMITFDNPYGAFNSDVLNWVEQDLNMQIGLCGAGASNIELQRFSDGFFMELINSKLIHRWVYTDFIKKENGKVLNKLPHISLREGIDDLRYYKMLEIAINNAEESGTINQKDIANDAIDYLEDQFNLFSKDMNVMNYQPIEGYPGETWGEYYFLDDWRSTILNYIVSLAENDNCGDGQVGMIETCNNCPEDIICETNEYCHLKFGCVSKICSKLDTNDNCCIDNDELSNFIDDWLTGDEDIQMDEVISNIITWKEECN
jgi:hypothetical protein